MVTCSSIKLAGLTISFIDMGINCIGIFLCSAVLLYQACFQMNCQIPATEAIAKELHKKYSRNSQHSQAFDGKTIDEMISTQELSETIESEFWQLLLFIILCFLQLIFNGALIHGVLKDDIHRVKAWLIFKACIVIVGIFLVLTQDSIGQGVYRQISEILYVFLTLFCMCIIFILYDTMHRHRQPQCSNNGFGNTSGRLLQT